MYSNIAKSARGEAGSMLWDELMTASVMVDPRKTVDGVVNDVVRGRMRLHDYAGYIEFHDLEFYTLSDIGLEYHAGIENLENPTPTEFMRAIVRADLTSYLVEYTLPSHLKQRANKFEWNDSEQRWIPQVHC